MSIVTLKCDKGVNKDLLPYELSDGWVSDCENIRFRNGFAETFEGAAAVTVQAGLYPYWAHIYETPGAIRYLVYAEAGPSGAGTVYVTENNGLTHSNITRYTSGVEIASITRVGTLATLTTTSAHGRTTGQTVSVYGAFPTQFNATGTITVTGATTFTYTIPSDPGANASTLGAYSYNVQAAFTNEYSNPATGGTLNGVLIYNSPPDGLYYWAGDTSTRLRRLPSSYLGDAARPFKNYIVQIAPIIGGTKYPQDVVWSNAAEPGTVPTTFTASDTNDAGRVSLSQAPGALIDCLPLGDVNIIYGKSGRYAMQYIGGNDVFSFTRLPGDDGVLNRNCVVDTPVGHVFLTQNRDVMVHQGGQAKSIADGRVRNWLKGVLGGFANYPHFLVVNPAKSEVWVCALYQQTSIYRVAMWNWDSDTWGIINLDGKQVTFGCSGYWGTTFYTAENSLILMSNVSATAYNVKPTAGGTWGAAAFDCYLEKTGVSLGDADTMKTLQRSRWAVDAAAGASFTATVSHGSAKFADTAPTYVTATYTHGTSNFVDKRATAGRFLGFKFLVAGSSGAKVRSLELDVTGGAKR